MSNILHCYGSIYIKSITGFEIDRWNKEVDTTLKHNTLLSFPTTYAPSNSMLSKH